MSARRAALLLGSAGFHGAVLGLLALAAARAGLPPVLVVDLSAWEAAALPLEMEARIAPVSRAGAAAASAEMPRPRRPGSVPPSVEIPGSPSAEPLRTALLNTRADAEPAPSRALAGSSAASAPPERHAPARPAGGGLAVGVESQALSRSGDPAPRAAAVQSPPGEADRGTVPGLGGGPSRAAGGGEAGSAAAAMGGTGAWGRAPVSGGGDGGRALGLGGGSRLALVIPGDGSGVPPEYGSYLARFRQRVQDALVYPLAARRRGLAGTVELDVLIGPEGRVQRVELASTSFHAMLDEAAIETVREMAPLPLPDGLPRRPLKVKLPLVFELR